MKSKYINIFKIYGFGYCAHAFKLETVDVDCSPGQCDVCVNNPTTLGEQSHNQYWINIGNR